MANPIQSNSRFVPVSANQDSNTPQPSPAAQEAIRAAGSAMDKRQQYRIYDDTKLPSLEADRLFTALRVETKMRVSNHQKPADFCEVDSRFGPDSVGVRCIRETHIGESSGKPNRVHANFVKLAKDYPAVICSQAPKLGTEEAFWTQATLHTSAIIDLTNEADREKKVFPYYPEELDHSYESLSIKVAQSNPELGETTYTIIKNEDSNEYQVERLHYNQWGDGQAITLEEFDALLERIEGKQSLLRADHHLWIHCRAGVGRTGTVTVALAIRQLHRDGKLDSDNYVAVIDGLIIRGRQQRDVLFVQSKDQYQLLLQYAEKLIG